MSGIVSVVLAVWIAAIAVLSVQNASAVSVRFLVWQSIPIPVGVVLAFAVGAGILGVALAKPLWQWSASVTTGRRTQSRRPPKP